MKKFFLFLFSAILIILCFLVFNLFSQLPDAKTIRRNVVHALIQKPESSKKIENILNDISSANSSPLSQTELNNFNKNEANINKQGNEVIAYLLNENEVNPCLHLDLALRSKVGNDKNTLEIIFKAIREDNRDPLAYAVMLPLKKIMQLSSMKKLIETVNRGDSQSQLEKIQMYQLATKAFLEIRRNQEALTAISQRAYYLFLISTAIKENPQLAINREAIEYCESILKNKAVFNQEVEAQELLDFLDFAKISPESLGFNKNYQSEFNIEFDAQKLNIKMGWIEKILN